MHSISLHVPNRLRSIRSSIFRSTSGSIASSSNSQRDDNSATSTPSTSISSSSPSPHKPSTTAKVTSEHYIPPLTWEPTTNEPHRLNSFVNTILRKQSEPSCTPRRTTEKRRAKEIAAWQPAKKLKYPVPPKPEHAAALEAWRWDLATLDRKMGGLDVDEDDSCSCISPRGSRRNSFGDEYWEEEAQRKHGGGRETDGPLNALDILNHLMSIENAAKARHQE